MHKAGMPSLGMANVFPIHGPGCPVAILTCQTDGKSQPSSQF
jgi:hydrogenase maturation factor